MGAFTVLLVALCCSLSRIVVGGEGHIEFPNRAPIKTVNTRAGIYDCIDIKKQPALNHPLLKNHQIQMGPTSFPDEPMKETTAVRNDVLAATLTNVGCPQGTVPIRRAGESFSESHVANVHPMTPGIPGQHLAILRSKDPSQTYYGVRAYISVNNPPVQDHQTSAAQMWAMAGPVDKQNAVEAGWMVSPEIRGDKLTRLFVKSTTDGYKTSCYNTECPSFVQINPNHPVDAELDLISVPGGQQYIINLELVRDNSTLDWWLIVNGTIKIGYFPSAIFTELKGGATYVAWGGLVLARPGEPGPPMGMGVFHARFEINRSGFFTQVATIDETHSYKDPDEPHLDMYNDSPYCYDLEDFANYKPELGYGFLYGGQGGRCGD